MSLKLPNEPTPFWIRVFLASLFPWLIISILVIAFLVNNNMIGIWIGIGLFAIVTARQAYWDKYYLLNYEIVEDQIIFHYQRFNKQLTTNIRIDELSLKWRALPIRGKGWELKFYSIDQFQFSQTNFGDWDLTNIKELLERLYSEIDREPSLETKMTLDWWPKQNANKR